MISRRFGAKNAGFTLIELMVVVAIVAILATIAIPNYADYVKRSRIVDATTRLSDFRVRMEQYFLDNRTYQKGGKCGVDDPVANSSDSFTVTCASADSTHYVVTATGNSAKGMGAFVYTIDQSAGKLTKKVDTANGWTGEGSACWVTRRDGSCI